MPEADAEEYLDAYGSMVAPKEDKIRTYRVRNRSRKL